MWNDGRLHPFRASGTLFASRLALSLGSWTRAVESESEAVLGGVGVGRNFR
jgi:hypothetical protein